LFTTTSNPGALHLTSLPTIKSAEPLIIDWRVATFKYKSHKYNGYLLSSPHIIISEPLFLVSVGRTMLD
jgi:hypothetical protein